MGEYVTHWFRDSCTCPTNYERLGLSSQYYFKMSLCTVNTSRFHQISKFGLNEKNMLNICALFIMFFFSSQFVWFAGELFNKKKLNILNICTFIKKTAAATQNMATNIKQVNNYWKLLII